MCIRDRVLITQIEDEVSLLKIKYKQVSDLSSPENIIQKTDAVKFKVSEDLVRYSFHSAPIMKDDEREMNFMVFRFKDKTHWIVLNELNKKATKTTDFNALHLKEDDQYAQSMLKML
eukprot:TRINITY_DN12097_c0_g1_i2.p1 TRINITY_DN12097_c0_g1~~TRINITY_DN12097_c0_g1_i2.p1  ORF type:complete len:117 (-),score=33.95 TRINITY_DN12097_c0_g1_i2:116-466(-)